MKYLRYVPVGDSQTEGPADGDEKTGYRGWTGPVGLPAAQEPQFRYANLAVRGRLAAQVRAERTAPPSRLNPDW